MKVNLDYIEGLIKVSKRSARAVCTRAGVTLESIISLLEERKVKVVEAKVEKVKDEPKIKSTKKKKY
jgi:ribosomal protein S13